MEWSGREARSPPSHDDIALRIWDIAPRRQAKRYTATALNLGEADRSLSRNLKHCFFYTLHIDPVTTEEDHWRQQFVVEEIYPGFCVKARMLL